MLNSVLSRFVMRRPAVNYKQNPPLSNEHFQTHTTPYNQHSTPDLVLAIAREQFNNTSLCFLNERLSSHPFVTKMPSMKISFRWILNWYYDWFTVNLSLVYFKSHMFWLWVSINQRIIKMKRPYDVDQNFHLEYLLGTSGKLYSQILTRPYELAKCFPYCPKISILPDWIRSRLDW